MENSKTGLLGNLLKTVPLLFTLTGLFIGLFQYNENYKREIRKNSYGSTFPIYQEFIEKCAVLSHYDKDSTATKAFTAEYKEFEKIYYGKLLLVQDSVLNNKATNFFLGLNKFRQKGSPTSTSDLEVLLYDVINAAKKSLNKILYEDSPFKF